MARFNASSDARYAAWASLFCSAVALGLASSWRTFAAASSLAFAGLVDPALFAFELVLGDQARVEEDQRIAGFVIELDGTSQLR